MVRTALACLLLATTAPLAAVAPAIPPYVAAALADPDRSKHSLDSDPIRKPAETVVFAGVKPGMTVGEFYPGGGYYTRILSDVVGPNGHVYGIENDHWKEAVKADTDLAAKIRLHNVSMSSGPFGTVAFPKPLDVAWVTQNYHDLKIAEYGVVDTAAFNRAVYAALKPGGTFMIIDHEAPAGTDVAGITKLHRIERSQVIREVEAAGFKLAAQGDFLREASDDHSLPIFDKKVQGHTDQYALKFVKPR